MILVSAGHHEAAQGASYQGFTEWQEACYWRELIVDRIGHTKARAVPSGSLPAKVAYINSMYPSLAVEIHFNSAVRADGQHVGRGYETLYYPGSLYGLLLAREIQAGLSKLLTTPNRGAKEGWYRMDKPGQVDYPGDVDGDETIDYFLRKTICPAVIVEPEFIHRVDDIKEMRVAASNVIGDALLAAAGKLGLL